MKTNPSEAPAAEALELAPADSPIQEVEDAWASEADRREAELNSGTTTAVSGPNAIARLKARLTR